ncbi:SMI1/KNR4 family protein (plasmid) [Acaryochloris sp. 'Moss Beach']|uniref:SMI1/KNR4 family protein n=1 Tax=Acaryochloris sp. 'Moss Beach' TaxID=2740837 RepID=UPI001F4154C9|nr:SMI1/KNR4 family protein [Acaryochloris sp. 'Moss Beach']UJB72221.1 SMI1/KNR4 family protein [Acaryochloris sp. 'Moss Beach']
MSQILDRLDSLVSLIENQGYPISNYLHAGLSQHEIDTLTEPFPSPFPEELNELYCWHNGQSSACKVPLFDDLNFLSIEEAINEYLGIQFYKENNGDEYLTNCFPFAGYEGDVFVLPVGPQPLNANLSRPVIDIFEGIEVVYSSFTIMLDTMLSLYRDGAFIVRPDGGEYGFLDINPRLAMQIRKVHNPGIYP